jgi:hypothetical protein
MCLCRLDDDFQVPTITTYEDSFASSFASTPLHLLFTDTKNTNWGLGVVVVPNQHYHHMGPHLSALLFSLPFLLPSTEVKMATGIHRSGIAIPYQYREIKFYALNYLYPQTGRRLHLYPYPHR